ncbi:MAG: family 43 glycosylhydrolase [Clostridia bacterium]|nr:family 43 glycosylhydrolase [Clostridia bacterium]
MRKRLISAILSCAVAFTSFGMIPAVKASSTEPVAKVTFDNGGDAYELFGGASLVDGRDGKALSLSGDSQYATVSAIGDAMSKISGDFAISVWTKPETLGTWARVYDFGNGSAGDYAFLTANNGAVSRFALKNGTEQTIDANDKLSTGEWQNVVISRSGSTTKFYINGKSVGTTEAITYKWSNIGKFSNYYIGKSQFDADAYYQGLVDDLLVYDRALTTDEIKTLAGDAYVDEEQENINKYNCQVLSTEYYLDDNRVFAVGADESGTLKSVTNIKNYTAKAVSVKVSLVKGATTLTSNTQSIASGKSVDVTLSSKISGLSSGDEIKTVVTTDKDYTSQVLPVSKDAVTMPQITPPDTNATTNGAHDPSIVKFDNDDTYYVYSSHHLIFTSKDLINWKKYDFTNKTVQEISPKTYNFITSNYANTTCNGTYWAPDVIYVEGDTHPYWMYISVSCGLGGRNSAISLMKSDNPLFWADAKSDIIDAGVVYATKENSNYVTNAIDANIYKDSANNDKPYFVWGSFWGGIQAMELNSDAITLTPNESASAKVIIAKYNEDKTLKSVKLGDTISAVKDTGIDVEAKAGDKVMLWNMENIKPVSASALSVGGFDGMIKAIDYSSDAKLLSSAQKTNTAIKPVFTQKRGVAGPEGAWLIEHDGYRYAFTSYAWLGSNYNTRVSRSTLSETFDKATFYDANGVDMSKEYTRSTGAVKASEITGYKLVGSFRLGDGTTTISEDPNTNSWYYAREAGDAHVYYGLGHNSVIECPNGEVMYCSHVRKDAVEGAATLQIRKMLFTSDGWPVVNPISYSGEKEQALPKSLITGTYDLASVGVTKFDGTDTINENWTNHSGNRNYDLPVISSKVTLNADNTMTNAKGTKIGTWSFDNNYTVTMKFTANGDNTLDEFYANGDTMTMFALLSYDKDEEDYVMALTGTDQKHITQMAKRSMQTTVMTDPETLTSDAVKLSKSTNGNPELGFDTNGNIMYAGDPAATVIGDTVYLIAGHDTATGDGYQMPNWVCYTSKDMTNWEYKGVVMNATDISWRSDNTSAWASQMVEYNGKYYLYFCTWDKTSSGKQSIGVAVANSPTGPYTDALGKPLVSGSFTAPESSGWNDIDPTVLIDTVDGVEHRYLAWGNGKYYICELNEDMTSVKDLDGDTQIVMHKDVLERKIKSMGSGVYTEAPWLYKRDNKYYLFYAQNWREEMAYAMCDTPMGRYDFKQIIMPPTATSNTNHPSVIDFNGKTYFIYHNGMLPYGSGFRRSICISELEFDENGYVYPVTETSIGLDGTASTLQTSDGKYLAHDAFVNSLADNAYPLSVSLKGKSGEDGYNTAWEIEEAKYVPDGENADNYVSIQSVNKPGLYISAKDDSVVLTQDADGNQGEYMTFKTVKGLDGKNDTVSFESVTDAGRYLAIVNNKLVLSYVSDVDSASFTVGLATQKDTATINIADIEEEPSADPDITQNFNDATQQRLIYLNNVDTPAYTALDGVTLYIGTRGSGADYNQNFSIVSGGVSGNALKLSAGSYQSASRGPRLQFTTPTIPDGHTVTASVKVKLGTASSVLRYNDSTTSETGTNISGLSNTAWTELKVTITNNADTYQRTMYVGGNEIFTDYIGQMPVLWGTVDNKSGQSVLFDDLSIVTKTQSGETPVVKVPEAYAEYTFDGDLSNLSVTNSTAAVISGNVATTTGKSGNSGDKALKFSGAGSNGVMLDKVPQSSSYTISFDTKLDASTTFTPFILLVDYDGDNAKTGDTDAKWVSIAPQGWQATLDNGPMVWSRDVAGGNAWNDLYTADNKKFTLNAWHNVTVTAVGTAGTIYVDGTKIAEGNIADVIDGTTKMFVGVNFWDTPLNGAVDNIRIYNSALTAAQVKLINE